MPRKASCARATVSLSSSASSWRASCAAWNANRTGAFKRDASDTHWDHRPACGPCHSIQSTSLGQCTRSNRSQHLFSSPMRSVSMAWTRAGCSASAKCNPPARSTPNGTVTTTALARISRRSASVTRPGARATTRVESRTSSPRAARTTSWSKPPGNSASAPAYSSESDPCQADSSSAAPPYSCSSVALM